VPPVSTVADDGVTVRSIDGWITLTLASAVCVIDVPPAVIVAVAVLGTLSGSSGLLSGVGLTVRVQV